jgi:GNAT superfamily N-acetyltransferase
MDMPVITFRPAVPADAPAAGRLILDTMGGSGIRIFGLGDPALAERSMAALFTSRFGLFSRRFAVIAEADGETAGLLSSFPGAGLGRLEAALALNLPRLYSLTNLVRLAWRASAALQGPIPRRDEYYIAHLAVFPAFRRQGVATGLLQRADSLCRAAGLAKCSLTVNFGHEEARRLYLAQGYRLVDIYHFPPPAVKRLGLAGFERMVKVL